MASDLTKYMGNILCRWLSGTAMPAAPTLSVALFNGDPRTTGAEVTTTIRVAGRVPPTWGAVPNDGTTNTLANSAIADFGAAAGAATVTHVALFDASTSGNMISVDALAAPETIAALDPVSFPIASLNFTIGA